MTASDVRAVVVDDEPLARDELTFMLTECGNVDVVGEARDAPAALELCDAEKPHVAFVDLRMPGPDGVALAEALRARHPKMSVVVISAHDEGAVRAYEAQVLDYLLKPVRLERLKSTLERVRAVMPPVEEKKKRGGRVKDSGDTLDRLAVRRRGSYVVVDIEDVVYFHVKDELVWAVTPDDRFALDLTLTAVEKRVPPELFFRSHRGVLVRVDRIRTIEPTGSGTFELVLEHPDEPRVALARERVKLLRERIPFAG